MQRALGRTLDDADHLRDLADPALPLRPLFGGVPVRREAALACRRDHLPHGRRWHLAAVRHPHDGADAGLHHRELAADPAPGQGVHDRVPGAGNADGRHLFGARPRGVLPVFRGWSHSDVPDHRGMGRSAPRVRQLQVFSLHAARLRADAARHHGDVLECGDYRDPGTPAPWLPAQPADLGVARVSRLVCGETADVAGAHLVAGRSRRGADRGLGNPRRHPVEDGRLRLPALLAADVSGSLARPCPADLRAFGGRGDLHLAGRARAGGHEEAHRLFLGRPYGLRHHGHFCGDHAGRGWRHLPDDLPRHRVGGAVPVRRGGLRPHAYARNRRLWRPRQSHAALCRGVHGVHARERGAARYHGFHRRIPHADRHVQGQYLGGDAGGHRHHPVGGLRAVALPQGHFRCADQSEPGHDQGPRLPRDRHAWAAGRSDHSVRHLPEAGARSIGGFGRATARKLRSRPRRGEGRRLAGTLTTGRKRPMTETVEIPALLPALPEIVLAIGAMVLLMVGAFRGEQAAKGIEGAAILLLVLTGLIVVLLPAGKLVTFGGSFIVDGFARFLKLLALAGSAAAILMSSNYLAREKRETFEYSILILLSTTGMMMLISAADLIALYLGLELMSLALYVVAAINRDSVRSTEAGLKYFVLGALSSGMLLYGASLVYG